MRWLARFAARLWFVFVLLPAIERELGAQAPPIAHHFAVPDTSGRIAPYLPLVGEYLPLEEYDRWWHEIAQCEQLALPNDYVRIRFFQVNAAHFYDQDRPSLFWKDGTLWVSWAIGQSYLDEGVIFMALPYRREERVVKHEMLHFLLFWNRVPPGKNLHPMPFYGVCGMSISYERPPKA